MEVLISLGFVYHCKLVTFVKKISEEFVQIWCELVKKEDWKRLEQNRLEEHSTLQKIKDSDSKDIFIAERQRVRIDVTGNSIVGAEVPKHSLLITFFPIADDNHIFPPLRKKLSMHGTPYSSLIYSMDSGKKGTLHVVTFDPWTLPKTFRKSKPPGNVPQKGSGTNKNSPYVAPSQERENIPEVKPNTESKDTENAPNGSSTIKDEPNSSPDEHDRKRAQVAVSPHEQLVDASQHQKKDQDFYKTHFDEFLEDFGITFVKEKCQENGIDDVETFLMLEKEDMISVLGLRLGDSLKCMKAKQKYHDLTV